MESPLARRMDGRLPLYRKEDLTQAPSILAGDMSIEGEKIMRSKAIRFIIRCGQALRLNCSAIATAAAYLHHFYMKYAFKEFHYFAIVCSSLFLASKVEDQKQDVRRVLEVCWAQRHKGEQIDVNGQTGRDWVNKILDYEMLILQVCRFNLRAEHPFSPCMTVIKQIQTNGQKLGIGPISEELYHSLAQYSWWLINHSLKSTLCLTTKPQEIALSCIQAATEILHEKGENIKLPPNWFVNFSDTMTGDHYEEIADQFIEMVEGDLGPKDATIVAPLAKELRKRASTSDT